MSADNGIYVAQFHDGYRVIEAMAIENLWYYDPDEGNHPDEYLHREEWKRYWSHASLYPTKEKALIAAHEMASDTYTEYGVVYLGEGVEWREGHRPPMGWTDDEADYAIKNNLGGEDAVEAYAAKFNNNAISPPYAVLMIENNLPVHVKVFNSFDSAHAYADELVMSDVGVQNDMPNWENGEHFDNNRITISIVPTAVTSR